jgi:hypothetical protein
MSRKSQQASLVIVPLWTRVQFEKAAPYLASMLRSLRESALEAKESRLAVERLARVPGQPGRSARIRQTNALADAEHAHAAFQEGMEELKALGINCLDPLRGEALVPFINDQQLAWFIYDLFAEEPMGHWRFHTDPQEMRRSVNDLHEHSTAAESSPANELTTG